MPKCPKCHSELKPETKFCAQCGNPSGTFQQNREEERAAAHESPGEEAAGPNRTRQIGSKDLSFQSPATPVERLSKQDDGASASDEPPPQAPDRAETTPARASRSASRIAALVALLVLQFVVAAGVNFLMRPSTAPPESQQARAPQPEQPRPEQPLPVEPAPVQPQSEGERPAPPPPGDAVTQEHRGVSVDTTSADSEPVGDAASSGEDEYDIRAREQDERARELARREGALSIRERALTRREKRIKAAEEKLAREERALAADKAKFVKDRRRLDAELAEERDLKTRLAKLGRLARAEKIKLARVSAEVASRKRELNQLGVNIARREQQTRKSRRELNWMRNSAEGR